MSIVYNIYHDGNCNDQHCQTIIYPNGDYDKSLNFPHCLPQR